MRKKLHEDVAPPDGFNLVCAVLVLEDSVVVKTVMHHFSLEA